MSGNNEALFPSKLGFCNHVLLLTGVFMMRKALLIFCLLLPLPVMAQLPDFTELVEKQGPAVVNISTTQGGARNPLAQQFPNVPEDDPFFEFFRRFTPNPGAPREFQSQSLGSGFIISADGYAVTNNHVVKDANRVSVRTKDGEEFEAKVVGTDPKTDLALIKIESNKTFQFVNFAKSEARVGDWVMAVGNPFGLGGSVTTGIVSARGRDIGNGPYDDFLQIDASINKGNSGGPAFNMNGEVIGVNTAIFSPSGGSVGIGFAIPASTTQDVIASLKDSGQVTRGWLGVQIQPVTKDIADSLGLKEAKGAIVADVTAGSPALEAGLKTGDTILKAGGEDIADSRDLARKVARLTPGKPVDFEIVRDGKPMTVAVKIGKMPGEQANAGSAPAASEPTSLDSLGLQLAPADDGAGAKITDVAPDSVAAEQGLKAGDVIVSIGGAEVTSPADVRNAVSKAGKSKVLMLVRTGEGQRFLTLPLKKG